MPAQGIGSSLEILEEIDSTNTYLWDATQKLTPHGRVVAAEFQTHGKGRQGRKWFAPPRKNLSFSVILRPELNPGGLATLAGACSVVEAMREIGVEAALKWPNDIIHRCTREPEPRQGEEAERASTPTVERKLGGVLCETRLERDQQTRLVLGIGINVNLKEEEFSEEIRSTATSVMAILGRPVDRNHLLARVLTRLERIWLDIEQNGGQSLLPFARSRCDTLGHLVQVNQGSQVLEGIAEDLDETGRLVLRMESGVRRLLEVGEIQQTRRVD